MTHWGLFSYFFRICSGISLKGILHIILVFWHSFLIHLTPLESSTISSCFNCLTSENVSSVKQQKIKVSRTWANRDIAISLLSILWISESSKKSRSTASSVNLYSAKGSFFNHPFVRERRMIFLKVLQILHRSIMAAFFFSQQPKHIVFHKLLRHFTQEKIFLAISLDRKSVV